MKNKYIKVIYSEYQASLFGACFLAFGLGIVFGKYVQSLAWLLIIIGIMVHGWGMYRIYSKNK